MLFKDITYIDENFNTVEHAYIGTKNGVIDYISTEKPDWGYGEVYDGQGKVLIPGFVNNHCHAAMGLMRGYGEGLPLHRWLEEKIFPFESKWDENSIYWAGLLGMAEMIACGTTSFSDMYFFDAVAEKVVRESGIKCNFDNPPICFDGTPLKKQSYFPPVDEMVKKFGHSRGRFVEEFGLHAEYTSTEPLVKEVAAYAKENGVRLHIHMDETKLEHENCKKNRGMTTAQYFEKCGIFENNVNLAHCVWVEDGDIEILAKYPNVSVTHCPSSNMKLGSGFAPIRKMLERGITVGLGTDGFNNSFFEVMRGAWMIHKAYEQDPQVMPADVVFKMATSMGAKAVGFDEVGSLEVGKLADVIVVDADTSTPINKHNVYDQIVLYRNPCDVKHVMCDGKWLKWEGKLTTLDKDAVRKECSEKTGKFWKVNG